MQKGSLTAGLAIVINALALAAICAVISLAYWLATGAEGAYLPVLSNLLFIAGALIVFFGAVVEFFHLGGTREIYKVLTSSHGLFEMIGWQTAGNGKEENDAGWALILLGAVLIVLSIVALFELFI